MGGKKLLCSSDLPRLCQAVFDAGGKVVWYGIASPVESSGLLWYLGGNGLWFGIVV